ncbi:MAG TPA: hypothetical protein VJJ98_06875 [Sedimentisphaerales bacterium]|nr:hypothetical protein [Sedimentisphaerales bacterium]
MKRKLAVLLGYGVVIGLAYPSGISHATTMTFYADGVIQAGDIYDIVEVYDTPPARTTVDMAGGQVDSMSTFDTSVVNISGGYVGFLQTNDSSTVNISGGWVGDPDALGEITVGAYNHSVINVYEGATVGMLSTAYSELYDSSAFNVYGGIIHLPVRAFYSANVTIYAGMLSSLKLEDEAIANIYGGDVGSGWGLNVGSNTIMNIYGYGFEYNPHAFWAEDSPVWGTRWVSKLTGYGFDGTPISITDIPNPSTNPNINLIPEPATFVLMALGAISSLKRKWPR